MTILRRPFRAHLPGAVLLAFACTAIPSFAQDPVPAEQAAPQQPEAAKPDPAAIPPAAQEPATPAKPDEQEPPGGKRVLGVLPNYRTASSSQEGTPITASQKLRIAAKDSFDYPLILLSGALAGLGQLTDQDPGFGQGLKGYGHRLITNYADQAMGNMFTEGFFAVMFHEDPRYFQRENGSKMYRTGYALSRVIITDTDSGKKSFNYAEWVGNASAVAISNLYYPDNRTATDNVLKLLEQVGTDAASQVLKEFWPDIKEKFFHKKAQAPVQ